LRPFIPGERVPGARWKGSWVHSRAGLDDMEKSKFVTLGTRTSILDPLSRPARSQLLYRLSYRGSLCMERNEQIECGYEALLRVLIAGGVALREPPYNAVSQ
jgi:hypothetical protein